MPFRPQKWSSIKDQKIDIFERGYTMVFLSQNKLFFLCLFWAKKDQKETFFDILDRKECFLDLKSDILQRG